MLKFYYKIDYYYNSASDDKDNFFLLTKNVIVEVFFVDCIFFLIVIKLYAESFAFQNRCQLFLKLAIKELESVGSKVQSVITLISNPLNQNLT